MNTRRIITNPSIISSTENADFGSFTIGVFAPGFAHTIGVSLRRVLLSSISGCNVSYVKVNGAVHKFCTLDNMKEDVVHFIENLKNVRFKFNSEIATSVQIKISARYLIEEFPEQDRNSFIITSGMIKTLIAKTNPEVDILNDIYLCTINTNVFSTFPFEFSFMIEQGAGYVDGISQRSYGLPHGAIPVNNALNAVRCVGIEVEQARHGEYNDYENLRLDITTDGSISPKDALMKAREILINQIDHIGHYSAKSITSSDVITEAKKKLARDEVLKKSIRDIGLKDPICSTLEAHKINTVGELVACSREALLKIPKLGQTKIAHIEEKLKAVNLRLSNKWHNDHM